MNAERILDAANIAALYHGDQRYGTKPYIVHPLAVASQVATRGGSEDQIVAALLHDTMEDTTITRAAIAQMFGPKVAALVASLTLDDQPYVDYVAGIPDDAVLIKFCDSLCNREALALSGFSPDRIARLDAKYARNMEVLRARMT